MAGANRSAAHGTQGVGMAWWCRGLVLWPATFLAAATVAWVGGLGEQVNGWLQARDRESAWRAEHAAALARAQQLPGLRARRAELQAQFSHACAPIGSEPGTVGLLRELAGAGRARGLQVDGIKPLPVRRHPTHEEVPVALKISGSYRALRAYLGDLAQLPSMVTLHDLALTPVSSSVPPPSAHQRVSGVVGPSSDGPILLLEATLRAYRGLDEHVAAVNVLAADPPQRVPPPRALAVRPSAKVDNPFDMNRLWRDAAPASRASLSKEPLGRPAGEVTPWLQQHPLDAMVVVGVLGQSGQRLALVRAGGTVHAVRTGQVMGLHGGLVTQISEHALTVTEPSPTAREPRAPRIRVLTLQENQP
jgi:type IV pilus assembly protein PilO